MSPVAPSTFKAQRAGIGKCYFFGVEFRVMSLRPGRQLLFSNFGKITLSATDISEFERGQ